MAHDVETSFLLKDMVANYDRAEKFDDWTEINLSSSFLLISVSLFLSLAREFIGMSLETAVLLSISLVVAGGFAGLFAAIFKSVAVSSRESYAECLVEFLTVKGLSLLPTDGWDAEMKKDAEIVNNGLSRGGEVFVGVFSRRLQIGFENEE